MEAPILLVADFANVDAAGKLNIIGAFNRIFAPSFPVVHPIMYLAIRLVAGLGEFGQERTLSVILFDEDGGEKWRTPEIKFTPARQAKEHTSEFHPIIGVIQLQFEKAGRYEFRVFVNDHPMGSIPLDVLQQNPDVPALNEN